MNTQDVMIFNDTDSATMHFCFVDKCVSISVATKNEQYDFEIEYELLVGLFAMYKEHCKRVDNKKTRITMSDFCENPFLKDTPVMIFSNGSEADGWFYSNCDKCIENEKCELRHAMLNSLHDFYCIVPLHIAKRIGIDYNALYQQGSVGIQCREYRNGNEPF